MALGAVGGARATEIVTVSSLEEFRKRLLEHQPTTFIQGCNEIVHMKSATAEEAQRMNSEEMADYIVRRHWPATWSEAFKLAAFRMPNADVQYKPFFPGEGVSTQRPNSTASTQYCNLAATTHSSATVLARPSGRGTPSRSVASIINSLENMSVSGSESDQGKERRSAARRHPVAQHGGDDDRRAAVDSVTQQFGPTNPFVTVRRPRGVVPPETPLVFRPAFHSTPADVGDSDCRASVSSRGSAARPARPSPSHRGVGSHPLHQVNQHSPTEVGGLHYQRHRRSSRETSPEQSPRGRPGPASVRSARPLSSHHTPERRPITQTPRRRSRGHRTPPRRASGRESSRRRHRRDSPSSGTDPSPPRRTASRRSSSDYTSALQSGSSRRHRGTTRGASLLNPTQ